MSNSQPLVPDTIRVLMPDDSVVEMDLDEYLKGVVPAEMGTDRPLEALKAQAVASRCYAVASKRHLDKGADVCTTSHCQIWKSEYYPDTDRAVEETSGVVVTYEKADGQEAIITAFYFGYCDGHTRNSEDVWPAALSYCRSVPCPKPFPRMWGHGVGMCQEGAEAMAEQGATHGDILTHYYTGVKVFKPSAPPLAESVVHGLVTDDSGAARAGLGIVLHADDWTASTVTTAEGHYAFTDLPEGEFSLTVPGTDVQHDGIHTNGQNTVAIDLVVPVSAPTPLVHVASGGDHLLAPDDEPFFVSGTNYEGYYDRAWRMWDDSTFDPDLIAKDFDKARSAGCNVLRLFVQRSLAEDVQNGDYSKLDTVLDLARQRGLFLLFTFNDYHDRDLAAVADLDAQIAARCADEPVVLGYDLENEPGFYAFGVAKYPSAHPAPIQTTALVDHYGEKMSQAEVDAWRQTAAGRRVVPSYLSSWLGYLYANAYLTYLDFLRAAGDWVREHGGLTLDYMDSPDSAHWQPFIQVLDGTVQAWLTAQMGRLRAADPHHLITVGYNNPIFARLPANKMLDVQTFHRYGSMNWWGIRNSFRLLDKLRAAFPGWPFVLSEFGYSNAQGTTPDTESPVSPALTSIYETAVYLHLWAEEFAGGCKWMLNDLWGAPNPYESNFGIFAADDRPKPIRRALTKLAVHWEQGRPAGELTLFRYDDTEAGYDYSAPGVRFVGATQYQEAGLAFGPGEPTQVFLSWTDEPAEIRVEALSQTALSLDPAQLVSGWQAEQRTAVYRQEGDERVPVASSSPGEPATFTAEADQVYVLVAETRPPVRPVTWYFAEGTTQPPFDELWMVLMNPQPHPVETRLTFMREGASPVVRDYTLQPTSQFSLRVNDVVPNAAISTKVEADYPIYAERTMYFGHGGHTSRGVAAPARVWYLTEGYTGPGFDTWVLLQNPNQAAAKAVVTFFKDDGSQVRRDFTLPPTSRTSIFVDEIVPNAAVATRVEADQPIIAERAMYFGDGEGHGTVGVSEPSRIWYLTEGYTGPGYDTWVLLMNPNDVLANATVYFLKEDGEVVPHHVQMRPTSRYTLHANDVVPNVAFGTRIESDQPIAAERAEYFAHGRGGHCSIGAVAPARVWNLAEGSTVGDTSTFILIMNPGQDWPQLRVIFMKEDGSTVVRDYAVRPHSRLTIHVNHVVPGVRLATRIESTQPVVAERAMYVHGGIGGTASVGMPEE